MTSVYKDPFPGTNRGGTYYYLTPPKDNNEQLPLVVLIHGIGCAGYYFRFLATDLETSGFRVLIYDLIGRGRSDYPSNAVFDGPAHVHQLRSLLSNLQSQGMKIPAKYHVIGHSQGGAVATLYVSQHPEEILSSVFLSPAGLMDWGFIWFGRCLVPLFKMLPKRNMDPRTFFRYEFPEEGELDSRSNQIIEELVEAFNENRAANPDSITAFIDCFAQFPLYDLDQEVQAIGSNSNISTLVVWGKKDRIVPFSPNFERWQNALGAATSSGDDRHSNSHLKKIVRYKVYEDLQHKFYLARPELSNGDIISFLRDVDSLSVIDVTVDSNMS